jgi:hypothetical protein
MENLQLETRDLPNGGYLSPRDRMEVDLRIAVSDFPVLHPASWIGIF